MNKREPFEEELLDLEKKGIAKYKTTDELLKVAKTLFNENRFYAVLGHEITERERLRIIELEPNDLSDELSAKSFLAGLEELTKSRYRDEDILKVEPFILYKRLENSRDTPQGELICFFGIGQGRYSFYLQISYYQATNYQGIRYIAKCHKEISMLEKIIDKYMCPNRDHFNVVF